MPSVSFFNNFGLLGVEGFLSPEECRTLRSEIDAGVVAPATVAEKTAGSEVNQAHRKTGTANVSSAVAAQMVERLLGLRDRVESTFGVEVEGVQEPQFLVYGPGDFFRAHQDNKREASATEFARQRLVSAVVFLNGESAAEDPEGYGGGSLTLYGLMDDGNQGAIGLPVTPEPGSLIAFPSDMLHEVTPITHGARYTVVGWFH